MATKRERYIQAAHDAGCPRDQAVNFIQAEYVAQPSQLPYHAACRLADNPDGPVMVGMYGTRAAAKSHAILAQVALDDCQRRDGMKWLYLRNIKKAAAESFEDITLKVLRHLPHDYKQGQVSFPNGSRILIGGYKDESDIDKYLGIEYDGIVVGEATLLSERKFDMVRGSLRTARDDWRIRLYFDFNPGGIGHGYCKHRFVQPMKEKSETDSRCFYMNYRDNKFCPPEYVQYLESLAGDLGKAWRDGDMDIFEGQVLSELRYEKHVIKPFDLPLHWPRWRSVDWGFRKPFVCLWWCKNPDTGRMYIYRRLRQEGVTDRQQARIIKDMTLPDEKIMFTFADPAMWTTKNMADIVTTTADEYSAEGVYLTKGDNIRLSGVNKVHRALADLPDGMPGLQIFDSCGDLYQRLADLPNDVFRPEDVDTDADDHDYDSMRMGLTNYLPVQLYERPKKKAKPHFPLFEVRGL